MVAAGEAPQLRADRRIVRDSNEGTNAPGGEWARAAGTRLRIGGGAGDDRACTHAQEGDQPRKRHSENVRVLAVLDTVLRLGLSIPTPYPPKRGVTAVELIAPRSGRHADSWSPRRRKS